MRKDRNVGKKKGLNLKDILLNNILPLLFGVILLQGFVVLAPEIFISIDKRNMYQIVRMLILNSILVYAFIQTRSNKNGLESRND